MKAFEKTGPHILLVEDNPGDIRLIQESFRDVKLPYRLSVARDGREAIDFLSQIGAFANVSRPDLIILDLNLPKISGHDVLAHLKGHDEYRNIPVVILTSSNAPSDIRKSYQLAANSYHSKPAGLEEFFHLMRVLQEYWLGLVKLPDGAAAGPVTVAGLTR
jgi:CheY-like chemotaxis protein